MTRRPCTWLLAIIIASGGWTGCKDQARTRSPAREDSSPSAASKDEVADRAASLAGGDLPAIVDRQGTQDSTAIEPTSTADLPPEPIRLAVLLAAGPLLVDVHLTVDGNDHARGVDAILEQVLAAADTDGDGHSTWIELAANQRFLYGPLVQLPPDAEREPDAWQERFDVNGDGRIDAPEASTFLGRTAGRSVKALSLQSSRSRYYEPRWNSRIWRLLDADDSSRLSTDELASAADRLLSRDADDDRVIYPHDLDLLREQLRAAEGMSPSTRSEVGLRAAFLLNSESDWQLISAILSDLYAVGQILSPGSFEQMRELFLALDSDGSGRLRPSELAGLEQVAPHAVLRVAVGTPARDGGQARTIELLDCAEPIVHGVRSSPTRLTLTFGEETVQFFVHDTFASEDPTQIAHSRLAILDQDTNGYIDEGEYTSQEPQSLEQFRALDVDGNGMVDTEELAEYVRLERAVESSQVRILVHNQGDTLFDLLDQDHDGRLGEREVLGAQSQLASLDQDQDGRVAASEVVGQMSVSFVRGEIALGELPVASSWGQQPHDRPDAPAWFVRGDFNGDGDLSRREFVGTAEQFRQLDADGDGFVTASEAVATTSPTH